MSIKALKFTLRMLNNKGKRNMEFGKCPLSDLYTVAMFIRPIMSRAMQPEK